MSGSSDYFERNAQEHVFKDTGDHKKDVEHREKPIKKLRTAQ